MVQTLNDIQNAVADGWQSLEDLRAAYPALADILSESRRESAEPRFAKLVTLTDLQATRICLMLSLEPTPENKVRIKIRVYPASDGGDSTQYVPSDLTLTLLSSGEVLNSITSTGRDRCIMIRQFTCEPGDSFSLQIQLDEAQYTEEFAA